MKYYHIDWKFTRQIEVKFNTVTGVFDEDTFTLAQRCKNACCLNFASHRRPGGGYRSVMDIKRPIRTQEEDLFRRSDLPELMDIEDVRRYYPLNGLAAFYCECTVSKDKNLDPIEPFKTAVVTVPAVVNPNENTFCLAESRARRILEVAADNDHEILILGAWGCGVFNNEPLHVAGYFSRLLEGDFKGVFKEVLFGVPGVDSENYVIFESVFGKGINNEHEH